MNDQTRADMNDLLDLLAEHGYDVTAIDVMEYRRGDPTTGANATGAEIDLTAYTSYGDGDDDENPYRVK